LINEGSAGCGPPPLKGTGADKDWVTRLPAILYGKKVERVRTRTIHGNRQISPVARPVYKTGSIRNQLRLSTLVRHDKSLTVKRSTVGDETAVRRKPITAAVVSPPQFADFAVGHGKLEKLTRTVGLGIANEDVTVIPGPFRWARTSQSAWDFAVASAIRLDHCYGSGPIRSVQSHKDHRKIPGRLRLQQITARADLRYAERLQERTRIARELHDTMLQSLQASLLHMHAARNLFSRRPEQALDTLDGAITMATGAVAEGRSAVGDLRSSPAICNDLARGLKAIGGELASDGAATFGLVVEGPPRDLRPVIQDEIYRIGAEALRNAFNHAHANHIEANIRYSDQRVRLQIRDDGAGIAPEILERGRSDHYGLGGMRERAKTIGARLEIWSGTGKGTEIDLSIPASLAYSASAVRSRWRLFKRESRIRNGSGRHPAG
jgi:signal transduction histidine kinase